MISGEVEGFYLTSLGRGFLNSTQQWHPKVQYGVLEELELPPHLASVCAGARQDMRSEAWDVQYYSHPHRVAYTEILMGVVREGFSVHTGRQQRPFASEAK